MLIAAITAAATLATHALGAQSGPSGIEIRAVRFWIPDQNVTNVMTTINVPYALAVPVGTGPGAYLSYLVGIRVFDSDHKLLHEERWARHASAAMLVQNASSLEEISFAIPAGTYQVAVDVTDSATGRRVVDSTKVAGFGTSPAVSDLLVASHLRAVSTGSDTSTLAGEMARGAYRFNTAPVPHIDAAEPTLGFLVEAYSPDSTSATLALKIASADGTDLVPLMPKQKSIPAGGGLIGSQFSLEGLPAGQYILKAAVTVHGQTVERQAAFAVNNTPVTIATNVANAGMDEAYFRSLPEDSLDAAAEELTLLPDVSHTELQVYKRDELSLEAKRRFLIEFWAKRDPNKATPENEARIQFYRAIDYVNRNYGTRFTAGWKTARGKVFAAFGPPDDSLASHMAGRGIPYLVWRYSHGKSRWFIFGDRQNNNNYQLLRSTEPAFPGTPGWTEIVTPESTQDIAIWLGLDKRFFINNP